MAIPQLRPRAPATGADRRDVEWVTGSSPQSMSVLISSSDSYEATVNRDNDSSRSSRGMSAAYQRRVLCGRAVNVGCHLLAFLVPAVLATNYTINVFYTLGAAILDSGWFAHLACHGLENPPALGVTFLADHMSAVLALLALVHTISPTMPDPVFFALSQGFWFGVLGLAASLCVAQWLPAGRGLLLALLCAMNGISLATLGFPHIEIAIPALILLVLALLTTGRHVAALRCVRPTLPGLSPPVIDPGQMGRTGHRLADSAAGMVCSCKEVALGHYWTRR